MKFIGYRSSISEKTVPWAFPNKLAASRWKDQYKRNWVLAFWAWVDWQRYKFGTATLAMHSRAEEQWQIAMLVTIHGGMAHWRHKLCLLQIVVIEFSKVQKFFVLWMLCCGVRPMDFSGREPKVPKNCNWIEIMLFQTSTNGYTVRD